MSTQNSKRIYLDHSATTPLDKAVLKEMLPYFCDSFGNANSVHSFGQSAFAALDNARRSVAESLAVNKNEIYFTSGGTESCNWAIRGANYTKEKPKLIVSSIEHAATLTSAKYLEASGTSVKYLPSTTDGYITPEALIDTIDNKTALVAVMLANNEVGTIQPIQKLAAIAKANSAYFFTDAVQAVGSIPVKPKELGVDMLALSAHKFYGPKGVGVLYIRGGVKHNKLISGGYQERSMRGGTSNVAFAVGLAAALKKAVENQEKKSKKILALRDYLVEQIFKAIPSVTLNGGTLQRLPQNANITFNFIEGESLLLRLDLAGIAASSGSACSSGSLTASHVLLAMGVEELMAHGSIRFTLGKNTTKKEIDLTVSELVKIVTDLRAMSPLGDNE